MTAEDAKRIPPPPQTGAIIHDGISEEHRGLWSQILTVFRDLSGSFDAFANDANPQVRSLGRAARNRSTQKAEDYFALGDLCAGLTLHEGTLRQTYADKTLAAYTRAGEIALDTLPATRQAIQKFAFWIVEAAKHIDRYESLHTAVLICEQTRRMNAAPALSNEAEWLQRSEQELRNRIRQLLDTDTEQNLKEQPLFESRQLVDQAQMLLRNGSPETALQNLDKALHIQERNHAAWLWRAMALTDLGRFPEAISSYDRALDLAPESAGVWNNKGALLMELGRLEPALACFERALSLASNGVSTVQAVYLLNKGKALYMLGRYSEALIALSQSHHLEQTPESAAGISACNERLASLSEDMSDSATHEP